MSSSKYSASTSIHFCIRSCHLRKHLVKSSTLSLFGALVIEVLIYSSDEKLFLFITAFSLRKSQKSQGVNLENRLGRMVKSFYLFFDQKLPHTNFLVCGYVVVVKKPRLVTPQLPPVALNSVMEINGNLLVKVLIHCFTLRHKFMMNHTLLIKKAIRITLIFYFNMGFNLI